MTVDNKFGLGYTRKALRKPITINQYHLCNFFSHLNVLINQSMYELHYSLICLVLADWVVLHSHGRLNQVRGLQWICPGLNFLLVKVFNVLLWLFY